MEATISKSMMVIRKQLLKQTVHCEKNAITKYSIVAKKFSQSPFLKLTFKSWEFKDSELSICRMNFR